MNPADVSIVVNGIVDLGLIGTVGWLIHHQRILLAASPKPSPQATGKRQPGRDTQVLVRDSRGRFTSGSTDKPLRSAS